MYLVKTPWWLKKLYPQLIWDAKPGTRCIYLTFDDGPIPIVTPFVLNILKKYNAKATFFCIGDNVRKHPDVFADVKKAGHAIGNHTYNHLKGWDTDDHTYLENFLQTDKMLNTPLFRPPYGRIKRQQVKLLKQARPDLQIIMWDVLSGDFDFALNRHEALNNVLKNLQDGSIVLFHDSVKAFHKLEYVLPLMLAHFSKAGYTFKALDAAQFTAPGV
ncbi:polysaccharide deacetylase family protein [Mucilaginibacter phyllosphaerae]|uniref:Peptidoglycan/xylan/chitin deacetylase (PgdA/CDA1 family) n=1 Tax=Mucilaginibacter phyllosphaerae TaxID=1812349 RepID=A0A4Y8AGY9_9SPHI|nr:polysaccharide deacetylase family protein [Mucilaginibacter phyllosphaerae]MBB3968902.1 peptidoglycan/xylan/chitin deacetylase (PgdA/CDA1 family) [Mucilaginibacter phyllosphaerae]TEW67469.1 polysaccharide deacetylase family protein [Mucilaginibacter phyllosphaerae]GGH13208.1 polysaccharide deacetylase [Mucilaginibacter phyllosphaerae]